MPGKAEPRPSAMPFGAAALAIAVVALAPSARAHAWSGTCEVRFSGTSTLHDFTGNARCQPFRLDVRPAGNGRASITGAEVAVVAGEIETGNRTRDGQMREMLRSDKYPRIRATFGPIDPESIRQALRKTPRATVPLDFTLTIRDVTRPVHAVAGKFRETGAGISFEAAYTVSLKDFQLPPPRALFGLVKVGDKVDVTTAVHVDTSAPN